jgi:hypothetical protein
MDNVFAQPELLQYLLTIAAGAMVLIVAALLGATGIKLTIKQAQQVRFYWSQYYPTLRAQFDQPTDTLPVAFDRVMDRIVQADWNLFLSAFGTALVDAINKRVEVKEVAK